MFLAQQQQDSTRHNSSIRSNQQQQHQRSKLGSCRLRMLRYVCEGIAVAQHAAIDGQCDAEQRVVSSLHQLQFTKVKCKPTLALPPLDFNIMQDAAAYGRW